MKAEFSDKMPPCNTMTPAGCGAQKRCCRDSALRPDQTSSLNLIFRLVHVIYTRQRVGPTQQLISAIHSPHLPENFFKSSLKMCEVPALSAGETKGQSAKPCCCCPKDSSRPGLLLKGASGSVQLSSFLLCLAFGDISINSRTAVPCS